MKIYLAGQSEEKSYRDEIKNKYHDMFKLIDPMYDEKCLIKNLQSKIMNKELFTENDVDYIVESDKMKILECDYVVAFVEKFSAGTMMEIIFAFERKKTILLIDPLCKFRYEVWIRYHVDQSFNTIDDCFNFLLNEVGKINNI